MASIPTGSVAAKMVQAGYDSSSDDNGTVRTFWIDIGARKMAVFFAILTSVWNSEVAVKLLSTFLGV